MTTFKTHLNILNSIAASTYGSLPAFLVPEVSNCNSDVQSWSPISYIQFEADVQAFARHFARTLRAGGISQGSVVMMRLKGIDYNDVVQIYGMSRAGYVPFLSSPRFKTPDDINELSREAKAEALIYDRIFESEAKLGTIPAYKALALKDIEFDNEEPLPDSLIVKDGNQTLFMLHTSGSTGKPKLRPCTARWLDYYAAKMKRASNQKEQERQDVVVWIGSMCHMGQTMILIGSMLNGSCIIQPSTPAFSPDELQNMITRCHLNRLGRFPAFLEADLRRSRESPEFLALLQRLEEIQYFGASLNPVEEEWAYLQGLNLRTSFGCTECPLLMVSDIGSRIFRPVEGSSCDFDPVDFSGKSNSADGRTSDTLLYELVVRSDSPNCPVVSICEKDGRYRTEDLFERTECGGWLFRGRLSDWISVGRGLRCDTRSIEAHVLRTCAHIVFDCVVIGDGRARPVLVVELVDGLDKSDELQIKHQIAREMGLEQAGFRPHEIVVANSILLTTAGSLPRTLTKRNIQRHAVEELYRPELDVLFKKTIV